MRDGCGATLTRDVSAVSQVRIGRDPSTAASETRNPREPHPSDVDPPGSGPGRRGDLLAGGLARRRRRRPAPTPPGKAQGWPRRRRARDRTAATHADAPAEDRGASAPGPAAGRPAAHARGQAARSRRASAPPSGPARARGHRPDLRGARRVRQPALRDRDGPALSSTRRQRRSTLPDADAARTFDGPLHNQIPAPDRSVDNSTLWQPDYNRAHYEDMYFNRMAEYYERQSSGRYSVDGDVTEWVKVPFNQALYGRGFCGDARCCRSPPAPRPGADPRRAGRLGRRPARRRPDHGARSRPT